jgi:hypothetical protein
MPVFNGCLDGLYRFIPERTGSFTLSLAMNQHIVWATETDMVDVEIHSLLRPCSTVVEETQQSIIPPSMRLLDINVPEDMLDFFLLQVSQHMPGVPLERYGKNGLALGDVAGISGGQIPEEGMNGSQPDVTCPRSILSSAIKVFQKLPDQPVGKIINGKIGAGLPVTFHCKL